MYSMKFHCAFALLFFGFGSSLRGQMAVESGGKAVTATFADNRTDAGHGDDSASDGKTQARAEAGNSPGAGTPIVNKGGPESVELRQLTDLNGIKPNSVILFQGDSITDGGRQRSGNDYNHTMGQDYAYILSAMIGVAHPERNLTFINRGIGGNQITDLAGRWQDDTLALKPDVLSILVGVNDALFGHDDDASVYEATYEKLIDRTIRELPHVKIVLIEPFILPVGKYKDDYAKYRAAVEKRQIAVARVAAKYNLPVVHLQRAMDEACKKGPAIYWSWDGIHPNYAGHGLLAVEWMETVNQAWR